MTSIRKEFNPVMSLTEVADYLSISKWKISIMIKHNNIPFTRFGVKYRFLKVVIDEWMKERMKNSIKT